MPFQRLSPTTFAHAGTPTPADHAAVHATMRSSPAAPRHGGEAYGGQHDLGPNTRPMTGAPAGLGFNDTAIMLGD